MSTALEPETAELSYGGTVRDVKLQVARLAQRAETVFERITLAALPPVHHHDGRVTSAPLADADRQTHLMAHGAAFHGWALVAVIKHIEDRYGPEAAWDAANIVQQIGNDGCEDWLGDDITAELTATAASRS